VIIFYAKIDWKFSNFYMLNTKTIKIDENCIAYQNILPFLIMCENLKKFEALS